MSEQKTQQATPQIQSTSYLPHEFTEMCLDVQRMLGGPYRSPSLTVLAQITAIKATSIGNWHERDWEPLLEPTREDWSRTTLDHPPLDAPLTFGFYELSQNLVQHVWYHNLLQTNMNVLYTQIYTQYVLKDRAFKDQLITNDRLATAIVLVTYMLATRDLTDLPETTVGCVEVWYAHWLLAQEEVLRTTKPQKQSEHTDSEVAYLMREQRAIRAVSRALELYDSIFHDAQLLAWGDDSRYVNKRYDDEIKVIEVREAALTEQTRIQRMEGDQKDAPKKTAEEEEVKTAGEEAAASGGLHQRINTLHTREEQLEEVQKQVRRTERVIELLECLDAKIHIVLDGNNLSFLHGATKFNGVGAAEFNDSIHVYASALVDQLQTHDFEIVGGVQNFVVTVSITHGKANHAGSKSHFRAKKDFTREDFLTPPDEGGLLEVIGAFFDQVLIDLSLWEKVVPGMTRG